MLLGISWLGTVPGKAAVQEISGPEGSESFGESVTVLPNGNFVVTDPGFDAPGPVLDVGAVYLYDGATLQVLSVLTGEKQYDKIGSGGITVLANGHYVVVSPQWDLSVNRGAVTWCNGTTGLSGKVTQFNSLVGEAGDSVGRAAGNPVAVTPLKNGNYVVVSGYWGGGRGAVTLGKGIGGIVGKVTAVNSLTGNPGDGAGRGGVQELPNGNYLVTTMYWNSVRGAVTWCRGNSATTGLISSANSLTGGSSFDEVGSGGITVLPNGNYIVKSPWWNANRGAVTWGSAAIGVKGTVSFANSLVGSSEDDFVGRKVLADGVKPMADGGYVVVSANWSGGRGAVTYGGSGLGVRGVVSAANSIVGSRAGEGPRSGDQVGGGGITELTNGNYTIASPGWNFGAGAVTWATAGGGPVGEVSAFNSLTGSKESDWVASGGVTPLLNGNYVVVSPYWGPGENRHYGAVTWGSGASGIKGEVTAGNSLTGSGSFDKVGSGGVAALRDGNYAVSTPDWGFGRGAVTWGNGSTGLAGLMSSSISLVGLQWDDRVGSGNPPGSLDTPSGVCWGVTPLEGGAYFVNSPSWNNMRGAVTRVGEVADRIGTVTAENSLTGTDPFDAVGLGVTISGLVDVPGISEVGGGNFVVSSPGWGGGRGAVTWLSGAEGLKGQVSAANSFTGAGGNDDIGKFPVTVLSNGNYVVRGFMRNPQTNGLLGVAAWGSAVSGVAGVVSEETAMIGDPGRNWYFGTGGCEPLSDGNYLIITAGGADPVEEPLTGWVTAGDGTVGSRGVVSAANSTPAPGAAEFLTELRHTYDPVHQRVIVSHSPGTRVFLLELRPAPVVTGNGIAIAHDDNIPGLSDHTDFGGAVSGVAGGLTRDFTVRNNGVLGLNLAGEPPVTVSGTHAADFTVTTQPESPVTESEPSNIRVAFAPGGEGLRSALLTIGYVNAAGGTAEHHFAIQGTGLSVLEHWRQVSFGTVSLSLTGDLEDFDSDGMVNLMEFAFGTNPVSGGSGPAALRYAGELSGGGTLLSPGQPVVRAGADGMHAIFLRRTDRAAASLSYHPEFSTDLIQWEESPAIPVVVATDGNMEAVVIPFPMIGPAGHFRIRAKLDPTPD